MPLYQYVCLHHKTSIHVEQVIQLQSSLYTYNVTKWTEPRQNLSLFPIISLLTVFGF